MSKKYGKWIGIVGVALLVGCGGSDRSSGGFATAPSASNTTAGPGSGSTTGVGVVGSGLFTLGTGTTTSSTANVPGAPAPVFADAFEVTIENLSPGSGLLTAISPGVWAVHDDTTRVFEPGVRDSGEGLESLAEDGDPNELAGSLTLRPGIHSLNTFGLIAPGTQQVFTVPGDLRAPFLSYATMLIQSNDLFFAHDDPRGIPLFDAQGNPLPDRVFTAQLWNAGTEVDESPGSGRNQAPRQRSRGAGPAEGVITPFDHGTRAVPPAYALAAVTVTEAGGTYTITIRNTAQRAGFVTDLAPMFFAVHSKQWRLFQSGAGAVPALETLAEEGSPGLLVNSVAGNPEVSGSGAISRNPNNPETPAQPGEQLAFSVTPDANHPYVSFASMIVESNDLFLALPSEGVRLLDANNAPRPAAEVQAEIQSRLAVWDAGTEANEVPGAGSNQPRRQGRPGTGPSDADGRVRRYIDTTNDLNDLRDTLQVRVRVVETPVRRNFGGFNNGRFNGGFGNNNQTQTTFEVTITNTSDRTAYPAMLSNVVHILHNGQTRMFQNGRTASEGIERLAEDGNPGVLFQELRGSNRQPSQQPTIGISSVPQIGPNRRSGRSAPLAPGQSYVIQLPFDPSRRYFNFATMVIPSNDTFLALGERGVELVDSSGRARSEGDIAQDITRALGAWDAGTESNEIGAAGPNQPNGSSRSPRQRTPNTGPAEGNGLVRVMNDPLRPYPANDRLIRVTVRPLYRQP